MVAQDLVVAWEDAYRRYGNAGGNDVTETSRAVAGAWQRLATCAELPWWLSAAVHSAAQAFEHQAEATAAGGIADANRRPEGADEEHDAYQRVVLPTQQSSRQSCACTDEPAGRATA